MHTFDSLEVTSEFLKRSFAEPIEDFAHTSRVVTHPFRQSARQLPGPIPASLRRISNISLRC